MAINYTQLFTRLGALISQTKGSLSLASLAATTLPADLLAIVQAFGTGATTFGTGQAPIEGIDGPNGSIAGMQGNVVNWRQTLDNYVQKTLTDPDTVVSQLAALTGTDVGSVLAAIVQDMNDNTQSVKPCTCSVGGVTALAGNTGTGTALVDLTLDGFNAPLGNRGQPHLKYNGLLSQLCVPSETMEVICTSDSFGGGAVEGNEPFNLFGGAASTQLWDYHAEGSGGPASLNVAHGATIAQNLNFENWSVANIPDGFTLGAGTLAGTHTFQEQTAANVFRGASSLKLVGDGVLGTIELDQALPVTQLQSRRRYCFTARIKTSGPPVAGTINILLTGTGYTAAGSEQITITGTSWPAAFTLYNFYVNLPVTLPSNLTLALKVTGTPSAGATVWIDSASFSPVNYFGGLNVVLLSGSTAWVKNDRLNWTVANDQGGVFQNYFRRGYGVQFPSNVLPSISDGLAA